MAYTPQPGNGAVLRAGTSASPSNSLYVQDMEFAMEQTAIESTVLTNIYKTFIRGRFSGRITCTLAATADNSDYQRSGVVQAFLNETARGSPVFFTIEDAGALSGGTAQTYVCSGIITNLTHSMRPDEIDQLRMEVQVTGTYS